MLIVAAVASRSDFDGSPCPLLGLPEGRGAGASSESGMGTGVAVYGVADSCSATIEVSADVSAVSAAAPRIGSVLAFDFAGGLGFAGFFIGLGIK